MQGIWPAIKRLIAVADRWQRGHRPAAVAWAVVKKFGNDNAGLYTVALGWYGFTAIYPLLLVVVTVLGYVGERNLGGSVMTTLHGFPIIGAQFSVSPSGSSRLHGSLLGLIIGVIGLLYGASGVTRTAQQAMDGLWYVPQVRRPNFFVQIVRSLPALGVISGAFVLNAAVAGVATASGRAVWVSALIILALIVVNAGLYLAEFRLLTPDSVGTRSLLPGATFGGVAFTLLITVGTGLVEHQLRNNSSTYGNFASIIGVVAFLLLLARLSLYAAELNPVLHHRYFPCALPTGELTGADRAVFAALAEVQQRRPGEDIDVRFDGSRGAAQGAPAQQGS